MEHPGTRRDNAGYIFVPVDVKSGCRGPACPAFALCQGRCAPARDEGEAFPKTGELHQAR